MTVAESNRNRLEQQLDDSDREVAKQLADDYYAKYVLPFYSSADVFEKSTIRGVSGREQSSGKE